MNLFQCVWSSPTNYTDPHGSVSVETVGEPELKSVYTKVVYDREPGFPFGKNRYMFVNYQIGIHEVIEVGIAGPPQYNPTDYEEAPLFWLTNKTYDWPRRDWIAQIALSGKKNYACRILVKCVQDCRSTEVRVCPERREVQTPFGPRFIPEFETVTTATWTTEWRPGWVYGWLDATLHGVSGPEATCVPLRSWAVETRLLCPASDCQSECERSVPNN
jgi:hypothetical protein